MILRHGLLIIAFLGIGHQVSAWIYPEHRYIVLLAIQKLSAEKRAVLDKLWLQARMGHTDRLTASIIDPSQGVSPTQLDYAAWAGIAGDHSCSPAEMMDIILKSQWILHVADITARLDAKIKNSKNRSQHINALRDSDIKLQRADPEYATRAGSNNVHFLLARTEVDMKVEKYLRICITKGTELNALSAYSWFHMDAMNKAARYATETMTDEEKSTLILSAFADEAFALHFLEDVYASGHTAGTWGAASVRKGTHDYYNEKGLEIGTWDGRRFISLGDAFMRPEDAEFAAVSVQLSLEQVIKAATGEWKLDYEHYIQSSINTPDTFNVCKNNFVPEWRKTDREAAQDKMNGLHYLPQILEKTPVPGLATGLGEIPRFRSELGMFYGLSSSLNGGTVLSGFGQSQNTGGALGGLEANLRFGLGLDGVLNQSGDGLIFLQGGFRQDASSTNKFTSDNPTVPPGADPAAIPGRSAITARIRLPFWLIPGDMVIMGPILALVSPKSLTKMAVTAANGGVIPWQSGIATPIGRFQFILGREVGISFYGVRDTGLLIPTSNGTTYISYSSTKFDFPFLEYTPVRTFSMDQSSSMIIQFTTGVDVPRNATVILPVGDPAPQLRPVWNVGVRIIFDWRRYF